MGGKLLLTILYVLLFLGFMKARDSLSYHSPLDIPLVLSGTFGELRKNHFHSGVDIKTNGMEGLKVYAVADGYVSRVKIAPDGFGKAIYLNHADGKTSVYAHLRSFSPSIESIVKKLQYEEKSFSLDTYFEPGEIRVERGETIAFSGNTGGSGGPHLHFEVRDSKTQFPCNALKYLTIQDHTDPIIETLTIHARESTSKVAPLTYKVYTSGNTHYIAGEEILINAKEVGIGIATFDRSDNADNRNGIYGIEMRKDGKVLFSFQMDEFSFDETRYVNAHIDYCHYKKKSERVHRLHRLPGNALDVYRIAENEGYIQLAADSSSVLEVSVKDYNGNVSTLRFRIRFSPSGKEFTPYKHPYKLIVNNGKEKLIQYKDCDIYLPANCLYEEVYFQYDVDSSRRPGIYSNIHSIHHSYDPAHAAFTVSIKPTYIPDGLESKLVVVFKDTDFSESGLPSKWDNRGYLSAKNRVFGEYYIKADTLPPLIKPVNIYEGKNMSSVKAIKFLISDNLSGIRSYSATIDGSWILMEYDKKKDLLTHTFEGERDSIEHILELTVTDDVNNISRITIPYKR